MRIAVVGTGIAGLVAAHLLAPEHELTIFEAGDYAGGHTRTVPVRCGGRQYDVDVGFVVYNERNYPLFTRLLSRLGVKTRPSAMGFSLRCDCSGVEYSGASLRGLFAQRRNLVRPSFLAMLADILRFNRQAPRLCDGNGGLTVGGYLAAGGYSREFAEHYLLPMASAIWNAPPARVREFPAAHLVRFFHAHGLLAVYGRPQWRVIAGGAARYVEAIVRPFRERIRLRCPVEAITRDARGVTVRAGGAEGRFEHVVLAVHADQALGLLSDATPQEREILGAIPFGRCDAVLHTDPSVLPRRRRAWTSWNAHVRAGGERVAVSYYMNELQRLEAAEPICVTVNDVDAVDPARRLARLSFEHPLYSVRAVAAQKRHAEISGRRRTSYCGAYWGYGFHEDGVRSALAACRPLLAGAEALI